MSEMQPPRPWLLFIADARDGRTGEPLWIFDTRHALPGEAYRVGNDLIESGHCKEIAVRHENRQAFAGE